MSSLLIRAICFFGFLIISLHAHTGINKKKCVLIPIVANCLPENPEVGTMVPKIAISHVGVFLLNDSGLMCNFHVQIPVQAPPVV